MPEITRLLTRIAEWQDGHGKPGGRADDARRLDEAHKLLDEVHHMLTHMRRTILGIDKESRPPGGPKSGYGWFDGQPHTSCDRRRKSYAQVLGAASVLVRPLRARYIRPAAARRARLGLYLGWGAGPPTRRPRHY